MNHKAKSSALKIINANQAYCPYVFIFLQFLGGTMIIIIGGIIVASVLVFIFILLMKYKLHSNHYKQKATARHANVCSQTNGGGANTLTVPPFFSSAGQGKPWERREIDVNYFSFFICF